MQLLLNYFHLYRFPYVRRRTLRPGEMMYRVAISMMAPNYNKSLTYFEKDDKLQILYEILFKFVCCSIIVCFVLFCVLFVCKCVLYYSHRVATQLQFIKYIISYIIYVNNLPYMHGDRAYI
jgi:hypothetical protein